MIPFVRRAVLLLLLMNAACATKYEIDSDDTPTNTSVVLGPGFVTVPLISGPDLNPSKNPKSDHERANTLGILAVSQAINSPSEAAKLITQAAQIVLEPAVFAVDPKTSKWILQNWLVLTQASPQKPSETPTQDGKAPIKSDPGKRLPRHLFLIGDEREKAGWGLYSYLLVPELARTGSGRHIAVLDAILERAPHIAASTNLAMKDQNALHLLLQSAPGEAATAAWFLANYNVGRSQEILAATGGWSGRGPFLASSSAPLSARVENPHIVLIQDLSWVPDTHVGLYVRTFFERVRQADYWHYDFSTFVAHSQIAIDVTAALVLEFPEIVETARRQSLRLFRGSKSD